MLLYEEIYKKLSDDIMTHKIKKNEKLPSIRKYSEENGVSKNTVQNAYSQLLSEGYIYSKERSGFFAADVKILKIIPTKKIEQKNKISNFIQKENEVILKKIIDLSANLIDPTYFPYSTLRSLYRKALNEKNDFLFNKSGDAFGDFEFRKSIADFLYTHREINCHPSQIIIGSGSESILQQIIKIFKEKDGENPDFIFEKPCFSKNIHSAKNSGCSFFEIPLDSEGLKIQKARDLKTDKNKSCLLHISPFHQFPMGISMTLSRKSEILSWAYSSENRYIIEDDYDGDFRYKARALSSIFAMDSKEKVIYMGTFSRTLTPSMKISFMVLPVKLLNPCRKILFGSSCSVSRLDQYVTAEFIRGGYLYRHINRLRKIYKQRRDLMIELLKKNIKGIQIRGEQRGLHFVIKIPNLKEKALIKKATEKSLIVQGTGSGWIIIGYAHLNEKEIEKAVIILSTILAESAD